MTSTDPTAAGTIDPGRSRDRSTTAAVPSRVTRASALGPASSSVGGDRWRHRGPPDRAAPGSPCSTSARATPSSSRARAGADCSSTAGRTRTGCSSPSTPHPALGPPHRRVILDPPARGPRGRPRPAPAIGTASAASSSPGCAARAPATRPGRTASTGSGAPADRLAAGDRLHRRRHATSTSSGPIAAACRPSRPTRAPASTTCRSCCSARSATVVPADRRRRGGRSTRRSWPGACPASTCSRSPITAAGPRRRRRSSAALRPRSRSRRRAPATRTAIPPRRRSTDWRAVGARVPTGPDTDGSVTIDDRRARAAVRTVRTDDHGRAPPGATTAGALSAAARRRGRCRRPGRVPCPSTASAERAGSRRGCTCRAHASRPPTQAAPDRRPRRLPSADDDPSPEPRFRRRLTWSTAGRRRLRWRRRRRIAAVRRGAAGRGARGRPWKRWRDRAATRSDRAAAAPERNSQERLGDRPSCSAAGRSPS